MMLFVTTGIFAIPRAVVVEQVMYAICLAKPDLGQRTRIVEQ
jgi:hypothetical protein